MKLCITTQIRENYGDTNNPHWKFKGGETYIVPNLSVEQALTIKDSGIPTLKTLIESKSGMFEEYVQYWAILDNDVEVCEEWETPFELSYEKKRWVARRTTRNDVYGYMHNDIEIKTEFYVMGVGGTRTEYVCDYIIRNGDLVSGENFGDYMKDVA